MSFDSAMVLANNLEKRIEKFYRQLEKNKNIKNYIEDCIVNSRLMEVILKDVYLATIRHEMDELPSLEKKYEKFKQEIEQEKIKFAENLRKLEGNPYGGDIENTIREHNNIQDLLLKGEFAQMNLKVMVLPAITYELSNSGIKIATASEINQFKFVFDLLINEVASKFDPTNLYSLINFFRSIYEAIDKKYQDADELVGFLLGYKDTSYSWCILAIINSSLIKGRNIEDIKSSLPLFHEELQKTREVIRKKLFNI